MAGAGAGVDDPLAAGRCGRDGLGEGGVRAAAEERDVAASVDVVAVPGGAAEGEPVDRFEVGGARRAAQPRGEAGRSGMGCSAIGGGRGGNGKAPAVDDGRRFRTVRVTGSVSDQW
ncbi:hypothetical protein O159_16070 [Leifsonia xyli subsp. cynodontis DSM 46306]|uniref:Uncharacterized protein n=1 Tax=Leifsonia xyli subsp. cynodontis DSM 46306 TaxID=1389489 RepID=U3P749_LEIXC|nr:hypothetical protein O159_16070 [Leifsonia xyli subsp. cynodontis DSM 46306]